MIDEQIITGVVRGIIVSLFPMAITLMTLAWKNYKASKKSNEKIEVVKAEMQKTIDDLKKELHEVVTENVRLAETSREYRLSFENVHRTNAEMYKRINILEVKAVGYDKCQEKLAEFEEENTLLRARVNSLEKLGGDL